MSNTFRPSAAPVKHTVIEEGSDFKGSLNSSCPIDVRGRIEGDVATPALTVSRSGSVHGRAKVGSVRSEGELSGEFDADTVELAGSVRDNTVIRARSLEVKLSAERGKLQVIFGETVLSVGDEPTEHDRVEAVVTKSEKPAPEAALAMAEAPGDGAPADVADLPAVPAAAEGSAEEDDEADEAEASGEAPAENQGKRRKKRKNAPEKDEAAEIHWSHPPSQPPPAN